MTTEQSASVLFSAKVLPTLLLIVMPFGIGIILPYLSPILQSDLTTTRIPILIPAPMINFPLAFGIAYIPGLSFYVFYAYYGLAPLKNSWKYGATVYFKKRGFETAICEYEYINKILYIEVAILILLNVLFYVPSNLMKFEYLNPLFFVLTEAKSNPSVAMRILFSM
jgi:hypothetical protein